MRILYSFNKKGVEASYWEREIAAASTAATQFVPFNHNRYIDPYRYSRAQLLDNLYFDGNAGLAALYRDFEEELKRSKADVVIVDNFPPYHPDYLRRFAFHKVLRIADGPIAAYDRDFAYLHAYDHILYHSPAYSPAMDMREKLAYCGAKKTSLWPLGLFDAAFDIHVTEDQLVSSRRDIDIVFVGALHLGKMPLLSKIKRLFGRRFRLYGLTSWKRNLFFSLRFGYPGWVQPIDSSEFVGLYRRSKVGINIHNRGKYTVGNFRLFELPANGVLQISDGGEYLSRFFSPDTEIAPYDNDDELIEKIHFYLNNNVRREEVVRNAYRRVMKDHRLAERMTQLVKLIQERLP